MAGEERYTTYLEAAPPGRGLKKWLRRLSIPPRRRATVLLTVIAGAAEDEPPIRVSRLTEHLYQLTTDQGSYTTNTLASVGDDGVLLADRGDD